MPKISLPVVCMHDCGKTWHLKGTSMLNWLTMSTLYNIISSRQVSWLSWKCFILWHYNMSQINKVIIIL